MLSQIWGLQNRWFLFYVRSQIQMVLILDMFYTKHQNHIQICVCFLSES